MNAVTVLLTTLIGLFSGVGLVPEAAIENSIRAQVDQVETLAVRVDTVTHHQLVQGEIERLRIAARGLYPEANIRIDTFDLETDPIDVNVDQLKKGDIALEQPLQAAVNVVLTQADIDQALRSPLVTDQLEAININLLGNTVGQLDQSNLSNPQIRFLGDNRVQVGVTLTHQSTGEVLVIEFETGLAIQSGHQLRFINPELTANDVDVPLALVEQFVTSFSQQYTLKSLEAQGITARFLQLNVTETTLTIAGFIQVRSSD